jgi:hypothetical protein
VSERISIAKLREQFTLWPQVLHVLDTVEAAQAFEPRVDAALGIEERDRLRIALSRFDFEDA